MLVLQTFFTESEYDGRRRSQRIKNTSSDSSEPEPSRTAVVKRGKVRAGGSEPSSKKLRPIDESSTSSSESSRPTTVLRTKPVSMKSSTAKSKISTSTKTDPDDRLTALEDKLKCKYRFRHGMNILLLLYCCVLSDENRW